MLSSVLRWVIAALWSMLCMAGVVILMLVSRPAALTLMKRWALGVLTILGVRLEVEDRNHGRYAEPPYLFIGLNQTSLLDFVVVVATLPPIRWRLVINIEFALVPIVGWATWALRNVVIVRQWPAQARRAINHTARSLLIHGESLCISIEGRRSSGGLAPYKKGPLVLALSAQATIVPMVIHGAAVCLPSGAWQVRSGTIRVTLCEALPTSGLSLDDRDVLLHTLRELATRELAAGGK